MEKRELKKDALKEMPVEEYLKMVRASGIDARPIPEQLQEVFDKAEEIRKEEENKKNGKQ